MIRSLLTRLTNRLPVRIISDDGTPYLERYYVGTAFGLRCYLHRFVGSDPDRGLHDHPWRFAFSIVLAGWYIERKRDGDRVRSRFNALTADTFHRVILPEGATDAWTLFVHTTPGVKDWGFLRYSRMQPHDLAVWEKYHYPQTGGVKDPRWWLHAPKGRDIRSDA